MLRIPPRFKNCSFEKIPQEIQEIVKKMVETRKGLYIWGDCGTGKTFISYSIAKRFEEKKIESWVYSFVELINDIKDTFKKDYRSSGEWNYLENIYKYKGLLILDDLGAEKPTEWVNETIYRIINRYYEEMIPMVITSNYNLDQLAGKVGDRIASRIAEMCEVVKLSGNDLRLSNKK